MRYVLARPTDGATATPSAPKPPTPAAGCCCWPTAIWAAVVVVRVVVAGGAPESLFADEIILAPGAGNDTFWQAPPPVSASEVRLSCCCERSSVVDVESGPTVGAFGKPTARLHCFRSRDVNAARRAAKRPAFRRPAYGAARGWQRVARPAACAGIALYKLSYAIQKRASFRFVRQSSIAVHRGHDAVPCCARSHAPAARAAAAKWPALEL